MEHTTVLNGETEVSQLGQLKAQISQLQSDATRTANSLAAYKGDFSKAVGQISATVGGSAVRVDQEMIETLKQAEAKLDAAVAALREAAKSAKRFESQI